MSDPVVSLDDFALYLNNPSVATDVRAAFILGLAQTLCETVVAPLPPGAEIVVLDVAQRGYVNPTGAANNSLALYSEDQGPFNDGAPGVTGGGLWLTDGNRATLRNLNTAGSPSSGAFAVDMTPAGALDGVPSWDGDGWAWL